MRKILDIHDHMEQLGRPREPDKGNRLGFQKAEYWIINRTLIPKLKLQKMSQ